MNIKNTILIFTFVLAGLFSASFANAISCPTDNGAGVVCSGGTPYYCGASCRSATTMAGFCPTNAFTPTAPCTALDACGACSTCAANHLLCTGAAYPTRSCVYNDPANHCATLTGGNCNAGVCASCVSGYGLCNADSTCRAANCQPYETWNTTSCSCVGSVPTLKLGYDSVISSTAGTAVKQSALSVLSVFYGGNVSINNATSTSALSVSSGNIFINDSVITSATPNAAITKNYLDSALSAYSSANSLWQLSGNNLFASSTTWNVGIGTNNPKEKLEIVGGSSNTLIYGALLSNTDTTNTGGSMSGLGFAVNNTTIPKAGILFERTASYGIGNLYFALSSIQDNTTKTDKADAKMTIQYNGNVGIGTTTPSAIFDVLGKTKITSAGTIYNTDSTRYLDMTGILTDSLKISGDIYSTAGELKTDGAGINYMLGSLGVGTNNPGAKLEVAGSVLLPAAANIQFGTTWNTGTLSFLNGPTTALAINVPAGKVQNNLGKYFTASSNVGQFGTQDNYGLALVTNSVERLRIDTAGNVGIGSTIPETKLHVFGDLKVNGSAFINKQHFADNIYSHANGTLISTNITVSDNQMMELYIEGNSYGAWGAIGGKVTAYNYTGNNTIVGTSYVTDGFAPSEVRIFHQDGVVKFWIPTGSAQTYRFRLATSFGISGFKITSMTNVAMPTTGITNEVILAPKTVINNNVAIGTTIPDAKLQVAGSFHVSGALNSVVLDRLTGTGNRIVMADASGSLYATSSSIATGLPVGTAGQTLRSDGTNWLANSVIYNNGTNVGIGTSTPVSKLHIYGPSPVLSIEDTGQAAGAVINFRNLYSGSIYIGSISSSYLGNGMVFTAPRDINQGGFRFKNYAGSEIFVINTLSGNVGVGSIFNSTVTAGSKLSVVGNTAIGTNYATSSAPTNGLIIEGYTGIGTTTPSSPLDILGKIKMSSSGTIYNTDSTRYLDMSGILSDSIKVSGNIYTTAGLFKSDAAGTNYMLGNLALGATSSSARLDVTGLIKMRVATTSITSAEDVINKAYLDSAIHSATSSISGTGKFVTLTALKYDGNNTPEGQSNVGIGYAVANSLCNSASTGSHVCSSAEMLNSIASGVTMPVENAWIFNGPPGFTTSANDCDARTLNTTSVALPNFGTYWEGTALGYSSGRGLLRTCDKFMRYACCK